MVKRACTCSLSRSSQSCRLCLFVPNSALERNESVITYHIQTRNRTYSVYTAFQQQLPQYLEYLRPFMCNLLLLPLTPTTKLLSPPFSQSAHHLRCHHPPRLGAHDAVIHLLHLDGTGRPVRVTCFDFSSAVWPLLLREKLQEVRADVSTNSRMNECLTDGLLFVRLGSAIVVQELRM